MRKLIKSKVFLVVFAIVLFVLSSLIAGKYGAIFYIYFGSVIVCTWGSIRLTNTYIYSLLIAIAWNFVLGLFFNYDDATESMNGVMTAFALFLLWAPVLYILKKDKGAK